MRIRAFKKSIGHALQGFAHVFRYERNFQIQMGIALIAIALMIFFPLTSTERLFVILLIGMVLILEIVNSALEQLLDAVNPRLSRQVQVVKDMMAAAVFLASAVAVIIGACIFVPYMIK